jgi:hypothetical protein
MSLVSLAVGISIIALTLMSLLIATEINGHRQDGTIFKMQRSLVFFVMAVAICGVLLSIYILRQPQYPTQSQDALVPASIAGICVICALIWMSYEVRLESESLRFGFKARKCVLYSEIIKIVDIRNQGSPRAILTTKSGGHVGVWSNLLGYEKLISELKIRCACDYVKLENRGQKG